MIQEPTRPTPAHDGTATHSARTGALRVIAVIAVCLMLIASFVWVMNGAPPSSSPNGVLAAGATNAPDPATQPKAEKSPKAPKAPKAQNGAKAPKGVPPGRGLGQGAAGKGPVTITSVGGNNLALATPDGWKRTITVTSETVITKAGQTVTVDALRVGDEIRFRQKLNTNGSYAIVRIDVPAPRAGGEVTAIDSASITVKGKGGATRVIAVNGSTVYKVGPVAGSKADVTVGSKIEATGTLDGDTFTATAVTVAPAHVDGEVTAKTGDSITVKDKKGAVTTIHVTGTTKYAVKGNKAASLADIAVGDRVMAQGERRADGSLDAAAVRVHPPKPAHAPKAPKPPKAPQVPNIP